MAQCEEAAEKMKVSEVTIAWSKLAGRADRIMREETRQHEGILTWQLFQSMLIEHFYHIPSKERAASLLTKLQQDPHESIGDYVQRSSEIIQVHSGKTNLKEIASSQYGWNLVQGLTNISIKNKIADRIAICQSLSDVCKLVKQVRREMENREAFTGISAEVEDNIEEVNWKQRILVKEEVVTTEVTLEVDTTRQVTIIEEEVIAIIMATIRQDNKQVLAIKRER